MLLNYHEMTMDEPRNSSARRQQFLVICTVIVATTSHALLTSGGFAAIDIRRSEFPGGEFVYKFTQRDYAASMSLIRSIAKDLDVNYRNEIEDLLYNLYLDDPQSAGADSRWASGLLVVNQQQQQEESSKGEETVAAEVTAESETEKQTAEKSAPSEKETKAQDEQQDASNDEKTTNSISTGNLRQNQKQQLLELNPAIRELAQTKPPDDLPVMQLWKRLEYQVTTLPSVPAAVVQFPYTDGFVSALLHSYRIFPKLRKYVMEHGDKGEDHVAVVITTCSITQQMCTHYAPLSRGRDFLLGQPDGPTYVTTLEPAPALLDWKGTKKGLKKMFPYIMKHFDRKQEEQEL